LQSGPSLPQDHPVLESRASYDDLIDHLVRTTPLQRGEAARVIQDVLAYFDETAEDFVRRRHRELQAKGLVNTDIFDRITAELTYRAVTPPEYSLRQLRRIVYG
jgi:polyhydroxyalkanoate synthesis regulator phasin